MKFSVEVPEPTYFCNLFQILAYWRTMRMTKLLLVVMQCYFAHQHSYLNLIDRLPRQNWLTAEF